VPHFDALADGSIVGLYLLLTMAAGLAVRRYVRKVDDFLVAGREMDVHLGVASLAATEFGIVTCMYTAQAGWRYGFAGATPGVLQAAAMLAIGWSGFCVKPLRDAGVLSIPELFEKRFGARVRWLSGLVIVLGGLLNMGLFLRIGGEFLVGVTGLDVRWLELTMTALLLLVVVYTVLGGMLSVLVTDFLQFIVMSVGLIVVTAMIFSKIGWTRLAETVEAHHGAGGWNPIANPEMGWAYVGFQACLQVAATLTWQPVVARVLASRDAGTAQKVYKQTSFFFAARFVLPGMWGIAALAVLTPAALATLPKDADPSLSAMPLFLSGFLPTGLMGLLVAAMLAADMSTDSSYMLTWGSVIYNDLLLPFRRKRPWSETKGLLVNRGIVAAIGVFLLFYGLWYPLGGDLWAYFGVTGTIYLSSMSVLLVSCCYWKRANARGATAAIACGAILPVAFLVLERNEATAGFAKSIGPWTSGFASYAAAALAMVVGSLTKRKERSA
jgi:SSS family solute:Na+ symporter